MHYLIDEATGDKFPNCKAKIEGDKAFCPRCGYKLSKQCSNCGFVNHLKNNHCEKCGKKL
ncbi:MAG: double zinc ribbon domain-containing protein [Clostridia bacterium]